MEVIKGVSKSYGKAPVTLDCMGVGEPIFDGLCERGLFVVPFKFSASSQEQLINNMVRRIEKGGADLLDIEVRPASYRRMSTKRVRRDTSR